MKLSHFILGAVTIVSTLFGLSGCNNNNAQKAVIQKSEAIEKVIEIDADQLENMVTNKVDFMLILELQGCSTCMRLVNIANEFIEETEFLVYLIDDTEYRKMISQGEALNYPNSQKVFPRSPVYPSFFIINDGEKSYTNTYKDSSNFFRTYDVFKSTVYRYIENNGLYTLVDYTIAPSNDRVTLDYLSTVYLDSKVNDIDKSVILFTQIDCPDCRYFSQNFLADYIAKTNKKLYSFEVSEIKRNGSSDGSWNQFKIDYGFSSYRTGRVPVIVTYESGEFQSMVVFVNDDIQQVGGTYQVIESFYPDCVGLTAATYDALYEKCAKAQYPLIKAYLDQNL